MPCLIAKTAFLLAITLPFMEIGAQEERRIDEEPGYFNHQDVYKAFNFSGGFWLHTQNFQRMKTSGRICTYFQIHGIDENGMNYSSHYLVNGTKQNMTYYGQFRTTPAVGNETRNNSNAFNASKTSEKWHPSDYRVIYSDYKSCVILRVFDFPRMNGYACMVLVSDPPANTSMESECERVYTLACNITCITEQIYDDSCNKSEVV
uniref:Putative lipocalin-2 1 n=1 Tax=Amblyomma cajennense TaxID=34607 RepID=A0A023FQV7_AMBCJ